MTKKLNFEEWADGMVESRCPGCGEPGVCSCAPTTATGRLTIKSQPDLQGIPIPLTDIELRLLANVIDGYEAEFSWLADNDAERLCYRQILDKLNEAVKRLDAPDAY
jgi:hypothetical protein